MLINRTNQHTITDALFWARWVGGGVDVRPTRAAEFKEWQNGQQNKYLNIKYKIWFSALNKF